MSDIDTLLDGTLDDLADVPEFKPFPVGTHKCSIKWEIKEVNKNKTPIMHIKAIETVELSEPESETNQPVKNGDTTNVMYSFKKKDGEPNELGQGQFKEIMKSLAAHYGAKSNRELMDESTGAEVLITTKVRTNSQDKNDIKRYTDVVAMQVI